MKAGPQPASGKSLYSATANCESGSAERMLLMIVLMLDCTFAIAGPMLPVVSDRKIMSDFGGMTGVWTCLFTVMLFPVAIVAVTLAGVIPAGGAAETE